MSEQVNPTPENEAEESSNQATAASTEATERSTSAPQTAAQPANQANSNRSQSSNSRDDNDDDYDDDYNYDDYEDDEYEGDADDEDADDEDADGIREIRTSGPADYVPSTQRGRSRRINNDVRIEDINYKNTALLTRFLDPRGRILSRRKTSVSAKVQRRAVVAIKRARHLALIPFTAEHTRVTRLRRRSA